MRKYHITGMEVKTVYNIEITPIDMEAILEEVLRGDWSLMTTLEAFTDYDMNKLEPTRATCQQLLSELWDVRGGRASTRTRDYIVRDILSFDGVENYGLYNPITETANMVVYKRGDRANG